LDWWKIYDYECGGHHPIHLGGRLGKDSQYRVIHKLGNGGFANIWLCRDLEYETPKYVGQKILMADKSADDCQELLANKLKEVDLDREVGGKHICLPLDQLQATSVSHNSTARRSLCWVKWPVSGDLWALGCIVQFSRSEPGESFSVPTTTTCMTISIAWLCLSENSPSRGGRRGKPITTRPKMKQTLRPAG
jgi:hypothetical protein